MTYVEWAGSADQKVIVPWQLIDGPAAADAFASKLVEVPIRRAYRTSISGALKFSAELFGQSDFKGIRRVIDVSGDGTNNQGDLIEPTRDAVLAKGITINGLPIMLKTPLASMIDIPNLARILRGLRDRRPRRVRGAERATASSSSTRSATSWCSKYPTCNGRCRKGREWCRR